MAQSGGTIYAIGALGTSWVKIGCTAGAVSKRLKTLQTGQPFPLESLASIAVEADMRQIEHLVHSFLAAERQRGEWFAVEMTAERLEALVVRAVQHIQAEARREEEAREAIRRAEEEERRRAEEAHQAQARAAEEKYQAALRAAAQRAAEQQPGDIHREKLISGRDTIEVFTDIDMHRFGQRLQQARLATGLRQYQLEVRCDLGAGAVNRLENGRVPGVRLVTAARLAVALRVSLDWLCGLGEDLPGHLVYDSPARRPPPPGEVAP